MPQNQGAGDGVPIPRSLMMASGGIGVYRPRQMLKERGTAAAQWGGQSWVPSVGRPRHWAFGDDGGYSHRTESPSLWSASMRCSPGGNCFGGLNWDGPPIRSTLASPGLVFDRRGAGLLHGGQIVTPQQLRQTSALTL